MPVSSRYFVILLCATLPVHAQTTAKKPPVQTPDAKTATPETTPARISSQSEISPLPAPDVEFASPVIVPARASAPQQTAPAEVDGDLAQFLSGKLVPLDIKLSEMKVGWQSLRVVRADEKNAEAGSRLPHDSFWNQIQERFGSANNRYFTQGHTLRFNNEVHLIVYRSQLPTMDVAGNWVETHFDKKANPKPQLADIFVVWKQMLDTVPVRASLINTRNISVMEDVAAFNFDTQFTTLLNQQKAEYDRHEAENKKQNTATKSAPNIESSLRQLFESVNQYSQDYDEKLPPLQDLVTARKALDPYLRDKSAWLVGSRIQLHPNARLSGKPLAHLKPYASSMILFYSDANEKGERWVLRLDGQVRRVNAAQWSQLKIASRIS